MKSTSMTFSFKQCDYAPKQCPGTTFAGLCHLDSNKVWQPNFSKDAIERNFCYSDAGSKSSKWCAGNKWDYVDFNQKTEDSGGVFQSQNFCYEYCFPTDDNNTCGFMPHFQMTCPPGYIQEPVCAYGKCTFDDNGQYTMVCGKAGGSFQNGLYYDALDNQVNSYDTNYLTTISGAPLSAQKTCYDVLCYDYCKVEPGNPFCTNKIN